ncbi:hypothetical protein FGO68_gene4108 [Halteria grandinella]|uniref:Uncharacterized protein n=1 Tax=Halteria grandinella TaxID=5974 RepID=A0A8J8P2H0_HALGN|nr:hypothetical protein FGO68_gene4108 [Halteria grandinella]
MRSVLNKEMANIFQYVQSEDYQEEHDQGASQWPATVKQSAKGKGLWYFTRSYLLQHLLFLTGLYHELHVYNFKKARFYYEDSISNPLIRQVEERLMKRALDCLARVSLKFGPQRMEYMIMLKGLKEKYKVRQKSVQVIMDLSNDDSYVHEIIFNFVRYQVRNQAIKYILDV